MKLIQIQIYVAPEVGSTKSTVASAVVNIDTLTAITAGKIAGQRKWYPIVHLADGSRFRLDGIYDGPGAAVEIAVVRLQVEISD